MKCPLKDPEDGMDCQLIFIQRLIFLLLLTCTIFVVYAAFPGAQNQWMIYTAFAFSLLPLGNTFWQTELSIALTGLVSLTFIFILSILSTHLILLCVVLALLTAGGVLFSYQYPKAQSAIALIMFLGIWSALPAFTFQQSLHKLFWASIGIALVMFFQFIFIFHFRRARWEESFSNVMYLLAKLHEEIFACFLEPAYQKNFYLFEKRIHSKKIKLISALIKLRQVSRVVDGLKNKTVDLKLPVLHQKLKFQKISSKLEDIFSIILDCGQLRGRVTDYSLFNICYNEIIDIFKVMQQSFLLASLLSQKKGVFDHKEITENISIFRSKIKNLEINYSNVLQIAAATPIIFIIFISTLKHFNKEMKQLYQFILR